MGRTFDHVLYNPSDCVTVDEQLLGFHGRCPFRQYMPKKPEKYGIKFWLLVWLTTCYVWKFEPYMGKPVGANAPEKQQDKKVVLDLIGGLQGHIVTMDSFFTSYELGQKLLGKSLTMVGTLRKNKRSIRPTLLLCKKMPLYQSTFAFNENTSLVSFISRKNKCAILQSTLLTWALTRKRYRLSLHTIITQKMVLTRLIKWGPWLHFWIWLIFLR